MRILQNVSLSLRNPANTALSFTPFNSSTIQTRWQKKPANTALTRLQDRIRDPQLDLLTTHIIRLTRILNFYSFISARKRGPFVSVQLLSKWGRYVGLSGVPIGMFLRKYPHIFQVFTHHVNHKSCCKFMPEFVGLLKEENHFICGLEIENVIRVRKILMMSVNGTIHLHALRLTRRELGLPEDFRESIIQKYDNIFRMVDLETVELLDKNHEQSDYERFVCVAEVEKWREREYREKWLSEFEVKYAFPMNFPTGCKKEPGFREKLRTWQRLNYVKPYEKMEVVRVRTCGGVERYEKRAVGIIHELLCLTVEKMVEVERLAHFQKDLGIDVNIREILLKNPGIFYLSIKGNTQIVFLREAYDRGCLLEPNPVYVVRRKMLDLILLGHRCTRKLRTEREVNEDEHDLLCTQSQRQTKDGDFIIPMLESFVDSNHQNEPHKVVNLSEAISCKDRMITTYEE